MEKNNNHNLLNKTEILNSLDQIELLADNKLSTIKAQQGLGIYASAGESYQYAIFGRDSIEAGEDLLDFDPALAKEILITMASLQGVENNEKTEEEVGKIHHEYRAVKMGGVEVSEKSKKIIEVLSTRWGGSDDMFRYYGSVDATPLFVRLVGQYVSKHGSDILSEQTTDINGNSKHFVDHVYSAAEWVKSKVESSPWGMLEFKRSNPEGLAYQSWKDSRTGYLHLDGTTANADRGIASIEVQGYAYDALMTMGDLKILSDEENDKYVYLAQSLQKNVLNKMWVEDASTPYFAIGLDRDENCETRQIKTCTSNTAAVLDSNLLVDLPDDKRMGYVKPIVNIIMSDDFLTDVGIRTRSLRHKDLIDFADYHGSLVSWPKETYDIAKGLRRHGFLQQAVELEDRLISAARESNEFYEFYYVSDLGEVTYNYQKGESDYSHLVGEICIPEESQAWTISAIMKIVQSRK